MSAREDLVSAGSADRHDGRDLGRPGTTRVAARAEVMKLARLLGIDPAEVDYLEQVPPEALRALREQVTQVVFDSHGAVLSRLAAASRLLPTGVIAKIAEQAFGAVLAALIAGLLEPERAAEVAGKLPTPFLAETAVHLDPRRAGDLLGRIPPERIAEVTRELVAADEHVTLGRFVAHLPDESLRLAMREIDDLTAVRVAFVLEDTDSINRVLALMDPDRVDGLLDATVGTDLWPDVLELYGQAEEPLRSRVLGTRRAANGSGS